MDSPMYLLWLVWPIAAGALAAHHGRRVGGVGWSGCIYRGFCSVDFGHPRQQ